MTRGTAKAGKPRSTIKRRKKRARELGSYALLSGLAVLWAFALLHALWWPAALVRELASWLGVLTLLAAAVHALLRQWDRAALGLGLGVAWCWSLVPFVQTERPTPPHGPTLTLRHYHLAGQLPLRSAFESALLAQPVQLVSLTFDSDATARKLPRPPDGFRKMAAQGAGARALWVRELEAGNGASTLRVGACSLALEHVSLPSVFDVGRRAERQTLLSNLPRRPSHQPMVWLGHMGSSPGAHDVAELATAQDLRDARVRHGVLGTFPALFGALGLPFDSVLVHGWIAVRSLDTIDAHALGAAQRGVQAVLELTEPRCAKPTRRTR